MRGILSAKRFVDWCDLAIVYTIVAIRLEAHRKSKCARRTVVFEFVIGATAYGTPKDSDGGAGYVELGFCYDAIVLTGATFGSEDVWFATRIYKGIVAVGKNIDSG